jgi:hypothetical protein
LLGLKGLRPGIEPAFLLALSLQRTKRARSDTAQFSPSGEVELTATFEVFA